MSHALTFEAIKEPTPGVKWKRRWDWSWPAYEAWFRSRGGDDGPSRADSEAALRRHMPELVAVHAKLTELAGGGDRAARFLSGWCPPPYLGGCTLAAHSARGEVRLVRNYDLSPDLNEGLLLRSEWLRPVMGMVEFLWGLSDGINDAGFCVALAYGGRGTVGRGFGITTIVRYLLETCDTVEEALAKLGTLPSHMAYNLVLADAQGRVASVELQSGGGHRVMERAVATNHQHGPETADRPGFTRTIERRSHVERLVGRDIAPGELRQSFLTEPLFQTNYTEGFGTLFTAEYDPVSLALDLHWPAESWRQTLDAFEEGQRTITYGQGSSGESPPFIENWDWSDWTVLASRDWVAFGADCARLFGQRFEGIPGRSTRASDPASAKSDRQRI